MPMGSECRSAHTVLAPWPAAHWHVGSWGSGQAPLACGQDSLCRGGWATPPPRALAPHTLGLARAAAWGSGSS